jgi:hypothetical protein
MTNERHVCPLFCFSVGVRSLLIPTLLHCQLIEPTMSNNLSLYSDRELSDFETDVDPEFEGGSDVEVSSESEVSESEVSESGEESDYEITPGVHPYEYVVAKVNIATTLAAEFYVHATRFRSPGTFPMNCDSERRRVWNLIDEFLCDYGIPRRHCHMTENEASGPLEYPRFIPSPHLVLIKKVLPCDWSYTSEVELLPVVVAPKGTAIEDCPSIFHLNRLGYTAVHPTPSPRETYPVLLTVPPLFPQHTVYQCADAPYQLSLGKVTDGQQTLLQPDSIRSIIKLYPVARKSVRAVYDADLRSPIQANGSGRTDQSFRQTSFYSKAATCLSDVIVDLDRSAVNSGLVVEPHSTQLSLGQELFRVLEITEAWVDWFSRK